MHTIRRLLALALIMLASGCANQTVVDGLPIGERVDGDSRFVEFAIETLDGVEPSHAPVASVEMHVPDYRNAKGEVVLVTRSGGSDLIVVLNLADGLRRAFYVGCGVGLATDMCFLGPPDQLLHPGGQEVSGS